MRTSVSTPADPADPSFLSSVNQEDYGRKDRPLRSQAVSIRSIFKTSKSLKLASIIDSGVLSKQEDNMLTPHLQPSLTCFPSLPQSSSGRGAVKLLPLARYEVLDNGSFELQSWRRWRNQRLRLRAHTHSHQPRLKVDSGSAPFSWGPVTLDNLEHVEVGIRRQSQNQGFREV